MTLFFGCRPETIVNLMSDFAMKLKKGRELKVVVVAVFIAN